MKNTLHVSLPFSRSPLSYKLLHFLFCSLACRILLGCIVVPFLKVPFIVFIFLCLGINALLDWISFKLDVAIPYYERVAWNLAQSVTEAHVKLLQEQPELFSKIRIQTLTDAYLMVTRLSAERGFTPDFQLGVTKANQAILELRESSRIQEGPADDTI